MDFDLSTATIADLQRRLTSGEITSLDLTRAYLERIERIDRSGPTLRSVIEVNPDAEEIAAELDRERTSGRLRGPVHGIPILIKDNIDTADRMHTTAGSLALVDSRPVEDATVAARLRASGALLLGKTNLSEWANFRSTHSSSGWSGRGGQTLNPYSLDRSPCGSSSGSGAAIAAGLAAASLGTETDGSILCPAAYNGIVGIKPTLGLTSRAGVVPIAHSQDTVGPMARTVSDAAALLGVIAGPDPRDVATAESEGRAQRDYSKFLTADALQGKRIGIPREVYFGYSEKADAVAEEAIRVLRACGAEIVDPANIPTAAAMQAGETEFEVLLYEFKADLNAYLQGRPGGEIRTLEDLIAFNDRHADREMPYFGQELLHLAQAKGSLTDDAYLEALETNRRLSRAEGIDAVLHEHSLDALVTPSSGPAFKIDLIAGDHHGGGSSQPAAMAGYPAITVPAGYSFGLPIGITFMGTAYSEPTLIAMAYAFEQAANVWRAPEYRPVTPS
jgi:amidase